MSDERLEAEKQVRAWTAIFGLLGFLVAIMIFSMLRAGFAGAAILFPVVVLISLVVSVWLMRRRLKAGEYGRILGARNIAFWVVILAYPVLFILNLFSGSLSGGG
jgi:predicted membrane-bound spermidine synthase